MLTQSVALAGWKQKIAYGETGPHRFGQVSVPPRRYDALKVKEPVVPGQEYYVWNDIEMRHRRTIMPFTGDLALG